MSFEEEKQNVLSRVDKSKKGSIDEDVKDLVNLINSKDNYYTTSSCSGRIMLMCRKSTKKKDASWLFCSHSKIDYEDIKKSLSNLPEEKVWFKQEPAILHVCCRTIDDAHVLVDKARFCGFKRTGIQSARKKINVEIGSSEIINAIIAQDGKLLITEEYLKVLIKEANKKMEKNKEKVDRLYEKMSKKE